MNFETVGQINLQPLDQLPWSFSIQPAPSTTEKGSIPYDTNISSVAVFAYDEDGVDVSSELIVGSPSLSSNIVTVTLQYPVTSGDGRYKLTLFCTLDTGSTRQFDFKRIVAKTI